MYQVLYLRINFNDNNNIKLTINAYIGNSLLGIEKKKKKPKRKKKKRKPCIIDANKKRGQKFGSFVVNLKKKLALKIKSTFLFFEYFPLFVIEKLASKIFEL